MTKVEMAQKAIGGLLVTPQDARTLLNVSEGLHNRPINRHRVEEFALLMKTGRWQEHVDGSLLYVNENGQLLNGQHRLNALIEADVTLPFFFMQSKTDKSVMKNIFDVGQNRTNAQITGRSKSFCSICEFLYRRIEKSNTKANTAVVFSFENKLKALNMLDAVLSMANRGNSKGAGSAPLWSRAAFITAKLLGYANIDTIFDAFIREDITDNFSNTLWKTIRRTGKPSSIPAKIEAYYHFLYLLKNTTCERVRITDAFKADTESRLKEVLA